MTQQPKLRQSEKFFGPARVHVPIERYPADTPGRDPLAAAVARAKIALTAEYAGITSDGAVEPGRFPIMQTGLSLRAVVDAAVAFAAHLDDARRAALTFEVGAREWQTWHNMHPNLMRHGVCLLDLDDAGRDAALALVRSALSVAGFENARNVMKINEYLGEISGRTDEFGEWYYFMSIFGTPSDTEPWGWQFDGHHIIINCFVLGDQMVLTPHFSGSEPLVATSGKYAGARVFDAEAATGLALMKSLSPDQRARATIGTALPRDVITTAQVDNLELPYAGIRYTDLTELQRELLLTTIGVYVGRIRPGHDAIKMDEVRAYLDETYFGWIGPCDDTNPFYYRIHSRVILIEFDHIPGVAYDNVEPTRHHVHTVVRTPNGNDYGRDLLRQHYARHDHSHPATPHRLGRE